MIRSAADYEAVGRAKVANRVTRQSIEAHFTGTAANPGPKALAHKTWKSLCDMEAKMVATLNRADAIYERKMLDWNRAEEARRAAIKAAADVAAKQQAEDARLVAALELEDLAETTGDVTLHEAVEVLLAEPVEVEPVVIIAELPKVAGIAKKKQLKVTVTDVKAMVLCVAAGAMLDAAEGLSTVEREIVTAFLSKFSPTRESLVGIRKDKSDAVTGIGPIDVNLSWLRSSAEDRREAFKIAGVSASYDDRII